ncbi:unnamed protein product [Linum trigynum]|uniref:Reverse transcriptase zinc-binding domain-containing protein n=1 Tax=Linum trigynum TaxID=586398 RepID=A0AAV2D5D9_9ROSI
MEKPNAEPGDDKMIWGLEWDGRFRLKSAYNFAANLEEEEDAEEGNWKALWRWKGPNRIKHFLWLVLHGRVFTNKERARRNITTNSNCNHCKDCEESIEHIFRGCEKAKNLWETFRCKLTTTDANKSF